ncbi:MAG: hypothetical protein P4M15_15125 [Alphaproteobacteria bacterium]|nr:hypothetical protein [Alphaproteobacteria bacterium]
MNKKTEAKCNGDMLMVGFHGANPPLIWRFDLERNHSFTLALQGDEGEWELGITTPKGDFYPVVHFVAREDAEEAFAKVEKTLARRNAGMSGVVKAIIGLALVALVVFAGVVGFSLYVNAHGNTALSTPLAGAASAPGAMPEGVPLPADQVLKPPAP